jgi:hypothetical protein
MAAMNNDTQNSGNFNATPSVPSTERRVFVLISIALVAVLFVGMVGLLYWRERPAPSALLILRVPPSQDGAIATVHSKFGYLSPIVTTLEGGKEVRIPLPPGEYVVKIEHKTRRIMAEPILSDYSYYPILLEEQSATQPSSRANTKNK